MVTEVSDIILTRWDTEYYPKDLGAIVLEEFEAAVHRNHGPWQRCSRPSMLPSSDLGQILERVCNLRFATRLFWIGRWIEPLGLPANADTTESKSLHLP
jgi:hypothetical protein